MTALTMSVLLQVSILTSGAQPYEQAHKAAMESGQPLLVLVGAPWCPACAHMKGDVVPELERRGALKGVVFSQVNVDNERDLAGRLSNAGVIPQLILYRKAADGWRRWEVTGSQSPEAVQEFLHNGETALASKPEAAAAPKAATASTAKARHTN